MPRADTQDFTKEVYVCVRDFAQRLGGIYFILARSDSSAVALNSLAQNKIYTTEPTHKSQFTERATHVVARSE